MPPAQAAVLIEVISAKPLKRKQRRVIEAHILTSTFSEGWDRTVLFSSRPLVLADIMTDQHHFHFDVPLFEFDVVAVVHLPGVHDVGML
jgi:hypothetical protein